MSTAVAQLPTPAPKFPQKPEIPSQDTLFLSLQIPHFSRKFLPTMYENPEANQYQTENPPLKKCDKILFLSRTKKDRVVAQSTKKKEREREGGGGLWAAPTRGRALTDGFDATVDKGEENVPAPDHPHLLTNSIAGQLQWW